MLLNTTTTGLSLKHMCIRFNTLKTHTQGWKFDWGPSLRRKLHSVVCSLRHRVQQPVTSELHACSPFMKKRMGEFECSALTCPSSFKDNKGRSSVLYRYPVEAFSHYLILPFFKGFYHW